MNGLRIAMLASAALFACGAGPAGSAAPTAAPTTTAVPATAAAPATAVAPAPAAAAAHGALADGERVADFGAPFGVVTLYSPADKPRSMVLFLSGDGGWSLGVVSMARQLAQQGAAVAGLDVRHYLADIAAHPGACRYMAADFETLAHRVQRELHIDDYQLPLLYGYSSGATIAYAVLVQSPPGTFGGAVSLGFCPDQKFGGVPLCPGPGAQLRYHSGEKGAFVFEPATALADPWIAFQGEADRTCPLKNVEAFAAQVGHGTVTALAGVGHGYGDEKRWMPQFRQTLERLAPRVALPAADVADLPLIEQPVAHPADDAPLAVLLTGDGGWAGLDRGLAADLNARGIPVVGLSTLKYYWKARTPDESARDVARVLDHYLAAWQRSRVLLVGYSFGANVLPFIINRLPPPLRARIGGVGLLGLDANTSFEIRVSGWLPGSSIGEQPVAPEIAKLTGLRSVCLYGRGEKHDPCRMLAGPTLQAREVGSGHHFSGAYPELVEAILQATGNAAAAPAAAP